MLTDRQLNRDSYISENKDVTVKKGTSIGKEASGLDRHRGRVADNVDCRVLAGWHHRRIKI